MTVEIGNKFYHLDRFRYLYCEILKSVQNPLFFKQMPTNLHSCKSCHLFVSSRNDIGGGTLLNHGVYGLMFAHQIFGRPSDIFASGLVSGSGTDTSVAITLTYRDTSQMASVICSCKADMPGELRVIGTLGSLKV